jgi:hypothetical protein
MEAHAHAARDDASACSTALARAERTFDRAAREDDPSWLSYFDEAYLAARMAQCFRDLATPATRSGTRVAPSTWMAGTSAGGRSTCPCWLPPTQSMANPKKQFVSDGRPSISPPD